MLLSFVLGATWFLLIATALATGIGLAVTLLGFPILIGTLYLLRPMARLERALVRSLLGAEIAGAYRRSAQAGWWPAVQTRLGDPQTWKDLTYLLVQLPLGIVWAVLAIVDVVLLGLAALLALLLWPWRRPVMAAALWAIEYQARAPIAWAFLALESTPDPALAEARSTQQRIVEAADDARRRIERDLHDGAQQRLVALSLKLGMARSRLGDVDGAGQLVAEAHEESKLAIAELRDLARGIHPSILTERGLAAALEDLAARCPVPTTLEAAPDR